MNKINLSWGLGFSSFFIDLKEKNIYSYYGMQEEIHNKYGGKCSYISRSGASGSGFITKNLDNILVIDSYRICWEDSVGITNYKNKVRVFHPESGDGPIVLSDTKNILFLPQYYVDEVIQSIRYWDTLITKEYFPEKIINFKNIDPRVDDHSLKIKFYNPYHCSGVNLLRSIDIPQEMRHSDLLDTFSSHLERTCHLVANNEYPLYSFIHPQTGTIMENYLDPHVYPEENLPYGWKSCGDGFFCKRETNEYSKEVMIKTFIEKERPDHLMHEGLRKFCEYEKDFNLFEWNSPEAKILLEDALLKKMREDYIYARKSSGVDILNLMKKNSELYICIQDSLDVGNCLPGTENFISRFDVKINENGCVKIETLLDNKEINKMVKDFNFQKVIYRKLNIDE